MIFSAEKVVASNLTIADWVTAGVILLVAIVAGRLARAGLFRAVHRGDEEAAALVVVGRILSSVAVIVGVLYALGVLGIRLGPLVGALGIGGLAIAFAAQSVLANFLASVILQTRRPFRRGDQIETNDCTGIVEDVNFRTVVLRTYGGERTMVPCAEVLSRPIVNHTVLGRRRTTLALGVSYDCDLGQARQVLLNCLRRVDEVREQPPPEVWVEGFGTTTVNLVLRFWHAPEQATMWRVRSEVAVAAKRALDKAGIEMALPDPVILFGGQRDEEHERADVSS